MIIDSGPGTPTIDGDRGSNMNESVGNKLKSVVKNLLESEGFSRFM